MSDVKITLELDEELITDYLGGFTEAFEEIEENIKLLNDGSEIKGIYDDVLRHLHSIKGNARMCELAVPERLAHVIEDVVISVKEGDVGYFPELGETIQVALEKVKESSVAIFNKEALDEGYYVNLVDLLNGIVKDIQSVDRLTNQFLHITTNAPLHEFDSEQPARTADDLKLLKIIGERYHLEGEKYTGRIDRITAMAAKLNELAGKPVDSVQLEAAICLCELDPDADGIETMLKKLGISRKKQVAEDIFQQIKGWQQASDIINQSNSDGASILRICQYYDDHTYPMEGRDGKRAILDTLRKLGETGAHQDFQQWAPFLNQAVKVLLKNR